ncbi:hypothetical protein H696_06317, partial [Fonticula alba]
MSLWDAARQGDTRVIRRWIEVDGDADRVYDLLLRPTCATPLPVTSSSSSSALSHISLRPA